MASNHHVKHVVVGMTACFLSAGIAFANGPDLRLIEAAKHRDVPAASALLKRKVDVNAVAGDKSTALHWAAHWDDLKMAALLIRAGARADATNDYGATPLWLASLNGSRAMVDILLNAGANANVALRYGETPLMAAARAGNGQAVEALLARGAQVDVREQTYGQTALMWAVAEQHVDVVRVLVAHGADVRGASNGGFTPLMFAARMGDLDSARLLLAAGADINAASAEKVTPLLVATVRGHVPFAEWLLEQGADPNAADAGFTPLHWATGLWESTITAGYTLRSSEWATFQGIPSREEKLRLIKALIARGAAVNARVTRPPRRVGFTQTILLMLKGATPLWLASGAGDTEVMRLLVEAGADPSLRAADGTTTLMAAAGRGRLWSETRVPEEHAIEAIKLSMELGNDLHATDEEGETALHAAALNGWEKIIEYLVKCGGDINARNKKGRTPFAIAESTEFGLQISTQPAAAALIRKLGGTK